MSCGYDCEYSCEECDVPELVIEFVKGYNQALEDLVKSVCEYYTMQEKVGYCADTNKMIKQRVADFAEQLRR